MAHLVFDLSHRHARGFPGNDEGADAPRPFIRGRVGENDIKIGHAAVCDEAFRAVDNIVRSDLAGRRLDSRRVGPGLALGQAIRGESHLPAERREERLFLLLASGEDNRGEGEGVGHHGRVHSGTSPGQFFRKDDRIHIADAASAVFDGNRAGQEPDIKGLAHHVFGEFMALIVFGGDRTHFIFRKFPGHIPESFLLLGQVKIEHGRLLPTNWSACYTGLGSFCQFRLMTTSARRRRYTA